MRDLPALAGMARTVDLSPRRLTGLAFATVSHADERFLVTDDRERGLITVQYRPLPLDDAALRDLLLSPEYIEFYEVLGELADMLAGPAGTIDPSRTDMMREAEQLLAAFSPFSPALFSGQPRYVPEGMDTALSHFLRGIAYLKEGKAMQAREEQAKALQLRPGFSLACHARGAANLAMGLPALAARDFDDAIRHFPGSAKYHLARAAARLAEKDYPALCRDLSDACALGDCSGLEWAIRQEYCAR